MYRPGIDFRKSLRLGMGYKEVQHMRHIKRDASSDFSSLNGFIELPIMYAYSGKDCLERKVSSGLEIKVAPL